MAHPPDPGGILRLLLAHDHSARADKFASALHLCSICFAHHLGADGIAPPCGHWHCTACMRAMAAACMDSADPAGIRCPQPECRAPLQPDVVAQLLGRQALERWDALMLQRALMRMADVVFCPRCGVPAVEARDFALCPGCSFAFCAVCCDAYHPGVQCASAAEKLRILDERTKRLHGNDAVRACAMHGGMRACAVFSGHAAACVCSAAMRC